MRRSSNKRTTSKERELEERIKELEEKLAASVPKAEFETIKSNLQLEINDPQSRLSNLSWGNNLLSTSGTLAMTQVEMAEGSSSPHVQTRKKNNPWHFPLKLLVSFIEAMGRGSEEFYVYLPLADEIKDQGQL